MIIRQAPIPPPALPPTAGGVPASVSVVASWQPIVLPNASEVGAVQSDEWLVLRARPRTDASEALPWDLGLLRKQHSLAAREVKFAAPVTAVDSVEVRAELFVPECGLRAVRVREAADGLGAALALLASDATPISTANRRPCEPDPAGADRLAASCAAAEWPCRKLPNGTVQVGLEPAGGGGSAILRVERCHAPGGGATVRASQSSGNGTPARRQPRPTDGLPTDAADHAGSGLRFHASVSLLDLEMYDSPITQRALALCLLRLNASVRGVRASIASDGGVEAVVLEACGDDVSSAEELAAVLGSLSVASQLASAETDALSDLETSRHYLAVMSGEPAEERTNAT